MLILPMVEIARFGVLETLFNPILSDSFGFDERNASYIFLAFGLPHIAGSILLLVYIHNYILPYNYNLH